eukprot:2388405-Rhodomonas_salina.1
MQYYDSRSSAQWSCLFCTIASVPRSAELTLRVQCSELLSWYWLGVCGTDFACAVLGAAELVLA